MKKSFSEVVLLIISYIYLFFGAFHLVFTEKIALFVMYGVDGDIASLLQKFNGASYLLLGVFLYLLKSQKGKTLYVTICAIINYLDKNEDNILKLVSQF